MDTLNILSNLIALPSLTRDGVSCHKIIQMTKMILHTEHVPSKVIKIANRSILIWGEQDLSKTKWLINSHLDVVPADQDQFIPKINKGKVWGRGSADTKSSCAIMLSHASDWQNIATDKHITFMLVTDEEVGGESTKAILSHMHNLKGGIFLEPTGEKMIVQAKGVMQLKITAKGIACHGSKPWLGDSALEKLTNSLTRFRLKNPTPLHETRATTFNFSLLNSGQAINQIPSVAELWCDIRWSPAENPENIISDLKKMFSNCVVETVKLESTVDCPNNSLLKSSFANSLKSNSINPISGFEHGSSDARHCTALGIPAIVFGPKGKNLHGINEWVSIKSLAKVEKVLDHWIKNI